jgi:uroporphyrinogen decarboxylase
MLEVIRTPELAAEITLQPIERFGFDAAIIFSDILPPLIGMGLELEFVKGMGPRIHNPIENADDIDRLATPPPDASMPETLEAIRIVDAELYPRGIPLIGFAGAPFTLASYAVEGGGSKNYSKVKSLMYNEPGAWEQLMEKLVTVQGDYLLAQAASGASALQVFDSWVGLALTESDYIRYVQPYNTALFKMLDAAGVPVINFSNGTGAYIEAVARCGGAVVGIDWRLPLDEAWQRLGYEPAIQGNLDPAALLAPWDDLKSRVDDVLARAGGRPGHIFNLGHGIFPNTSVDQVQRLVDYVRERTAGASAQPKASPQ